ncbi:MAG TPA: sulfotransferase [Fimbriimonas sp.]|nr:sulfotransferase [Fimbriimonas sp.]
MNAQAEVERAIGALQSGQFENAERILNNVLASDPQNANALAVLANIHSRRQQFGQAVSCFDRAIRLKPGEAPLYFGRAEANERLYRFSAAIQDLQSSVRLARHPSALLALGRLRLTLGQHADALPLLQEGTRAQPNSPAAHILLARCLTEMNRADEAEVHWKRAQSLEPNSPRATLEKAKTLNWIGHFEEGRTELRRLIQQYPREATAYCLLTGSGRFAEQDRPLIDQMSKLSEDPALREGDRIGLLYALGKAHDNLGDYQTAMSFYDRANAREHAALSRLRPFDKKRYAEQTDAHIRLFSKELLARYRDEGSASDLPIFVVGMMRAGTTFAEQVLSSHGQIGPSGEQPFWSDVAPRVMNFANQSLDIEAVRSLSREYVDLLRALSPGTPRVVDKNPGNLMVAPLLHIAFPKSPIIHMRRNAVDTALSLWITPMETNASFMGDKANIVFAYREYLRFSDHCREVLPSERYQEVSYEALTSEPEKVTRQMIDFCGLPWDDACLHPERNSRTIRTPSFWQARQPIYRSSVERWKRYEPWLGEFDELRGL